MLNRRHIRIKLLQAFYAFFQSDNQDILKGEKEFMHSMDRIYDLYIYMILLFVAIKRQAMIQVEEAKRPTYLQKDPNALSSRFIDNLLLQQLEESDQLQKLSDKRKVSWVGDVENDLVKKLYRSIYTSPAYIKILESSFEDFVSDKNLLLQLFKDEICNFSLLHHFFEEKSIYWQDDLDHVASMVIKTLKSGDEFGEINILPLWKEDEEEYAKELFRQAIKQKDENDQIMQSYSKNWESDRLAKMDSLLMNLAMTEVRVFSSIPVKVTMNEYIEISKFYSTPKSNKFINGLLDKIFDDFKKSGKVKKVGRGLIE